MSPVTNSNPEVTIRVFRGWVLRRTLYDRHSAEGRRLARYERRWESGSLDCAEAEAEAEAVDDDERWFHVKSVLDVFVEERVEACRILEAEFGDRRGTVRVGRRRNVDMTLCTNKGRGKDLNVVEYVFSQAVSSHPPPPGLKRLKFLR